jgi:hypothetical protein
VKLLATHFLSLLVFPLRFKHSPGPKEASRPRPILTVTIGLCCTACT